MNRDYVLFNLREARDELERTLRDVETNPDYGHAEFAVAIGHLYHHLNTAWNARNSSAEEAAECSQQNFDRWRQFPSSDELYLA